MKGSLNQPRFVENSVIVYSNLIGMGNRHQKQEAVYGQVELRINYEKTEFMTNLARARNPKVHGEEIKVKS